LEIITVNNTLTACSAKHDNVTVWRLSIPSTHIQRDTPGGSTRRGQRKLPSEYYEDDIGYLL